MKLEPAEAATMGGKIRFPAPKNIENSMSEMEIIPIFGRTVSVFVVGIKNLRTIVA